MWCPITFTLVVDDFGIKVVGDKHINHLLKTLEKDYDVTVDWRQLLMGIKLEWDCEKRTLDTHISCFVPSALYKYRHKVSSKPQHTPTKAAPIVYGANI